MCMSAIDEYLELQYVMVMQSLPEISVGYRNGISEC